MIYRCLIFALKMIIPRKPIWNLLFQFHPQGKLSTSCQPYIIRSWKHDCFEVWGTTYRLISALALCWRKHIFHWNCTYTSWRTKCVSRIVNDAGQARSGRISLAKCNYMVLILWPANWTTRFIVFLKSITLWDCFRELNNFHCFHNVQSNSMPRQGHQIRCT